MKLLKIQEAVVAALGEVEWIAQRGIPVVAEDKGDVKKNLDAALLNAKRGILVQTPGLRVTSNASKVMVGVASVVVQTIERVLVGRDGAGGATAQDMAEVVAWNLNLLPVEGVGVLVVKNISSEMLKDDTLAYAVALDVQTTLGDPLDNGKEEAV